MREYTFAEDKKRRIKCPTCESFQKESRLLDDKVVEKKCQGCGSLIRIVPPTKVVKDGQRMINYGIGTDKGQGGVWTADPE